MNRPRLLVFSMLVFGCAVVLEACDALTSAEPEPETQLNGPLDGLTPQQQQNHFLGDEEFGRIFAITDGLGPIYVSNSCESCHVGDGKGHPSTTLTRFNRQDGLDFDPMISVGASQLQQFSIAGYTAEVLPTNIKGSARLIPPSVTGLGYLSAVTDADILAMADPADANGDGISGVPNYLPAPGFFVPQSFHLKDNAGRYIGRFGKKAGAIDLLQQTANAYLLDMGITSNFLTEDLYNELLGNHTGDQVPDPEIPGSVVRNVVFYLRTLKAPPRRHPQHPDVAEGEKLFSQIGCNGCHVSTLQTGMSDIQALSNQTFHPYTDLLLHDMGNELDDHYTEGAARTSEWRTTPLWGLGLARDAQGGQAFLLHDGRAKSYQEAIGYHGGEGATSREKFNQLSAAEKEQLIQFLESL